MLDEFLIAFGMLYQDAQLVYRYEDEDHNDREYGYQEHVEL